jgi:hypothetical protein
MKRIKLILVCGAVLAFTGLATLVVAAGAQIDARALVRSVVGSVTYQADGTGPFLPLKVNTELGPKTVLKSGPGANAYLQVNGRTSTVKLSESTTVTLTKMVTTGNGSDADTSTDLKLDGGTLLGSVKKISANSDYKITTPNGTAGIRGTDFQVTVTVQPNGMLSITFMSVTGTVVCQVNNVPAGTPAGGNTQTLTSGQSWTVTATVTGTTVTIAQPVPVPPAILVAITTAVSSLPPVVNNPAPGGGGGGSTGGGGTTTPPQQPIPQPVAPNPSNPNGGDTTPQPPV